MGVPAFFRWLSVRYPKVAINALSDEDLEHLYDDFKKTSDDNKDPNEINLLDGDLDGEIEKRVRENNPEFDNLYLDMNGIIHPCTHPQDKPQPTSETEMFNNIFDYTDKIMKIVRPQRLIYMAVDGVAPRAKMNQQRSRRFRGALDTEEREQREEEIRGKWSKEGIKFSQKKDEEDGDSDKFDQNVITPGTEFMFRLSKALQYYVMERLQTDSLWKDIKVIFSDASNPGEGEHKILDFIRSQRLQAGYNPNTRHCIYGADADLIMLGLSTHEPHFAILREAVLMDSDKKCTYCGQNGHLNSECKSNPDIAGGPKVQLSRSVKFQFIKLNVVREYLYLEFKDIQDRQLPFQFDFERIVDDFVFLCFFVGNDFLPHLPSLHIREGALDAILVIYKNLLPSLGDYLTKNGEIDFGKVDIIFNDIAKIEEESFKMKKENEERYAERLLRDAQGGNTRGGFRGGRGRGGQRGGYNNQQRPEHVKFDQQLPKTDTEVVLASKVSLTAGAPDAILDKEEIKVEAQEQAKLLDQASVTKPAADSVEEFEKSQIQELSKLKQELDEEELNKLASDKMKEIVKKMLSEKNKQMADSYIDKVKFGTEGWKLRYYQDKFHIDVNDFQEFTDKIKQAYIEGLQWVYSYYYKGCVSWYWFYPYHYAPFASDLVNCDRVKIKFEMGVPAQPFEQLMGVMPKQSAHCIPPCYRHLLSSPKSEIIDFYPIDFRLDINGARYAWMGVNLLPFIDRQRLIKAMRKADQDGAKLTPIEQDRNRTGTVMLFFARNEKSESALQQTLDKKLNGNLELFASFQRKDQISGTVKVLKNAHQIGQKISRPHVKLQMSDITDNQVYQINYEHPTYDQHLTKLLDGLKHEPKEVEEFEIYSLNRRFFNGENAVRMLERILGIDASVSAVYRPQGYQNNQGNYNQQRQVDQAFRGSGSSQYAYSGQGGYNQGYSGSSGHGYQQQQQDHMLGKRGQRDYSNDDRGYHQDKRYEASAQGGHYSGQGGNYGHQGGYNRQNQHYQGSQGYGGYNQHQEQQQQQPPNINYNLGYNNNNRRDYNQQQSHSTSNQHQDYQQQNRQNQRGHQQSNSSYDNRQQYGSSNQNYQQHQQQYQQQYNQCSQQSSVLAQPQPYQQPQQQPPNQLINLLQQLQNVPQQRNQQNQGQNGGQQQNNGQDRNSSNYNRFQGFGQ